MMRLLLFILFFSSTICHAEQQLQIYDLTGDWISKEFVDSVKRNKTLINAKSPGYSSFEIKKQGDVYTFLMSFKGFHEGYTSFVSDIVSVNENKYRIKYEVRNGENSAFYSPRFVELHPDNNHVYFYYVDWEKSKDTDKNPVITKSLYIKAEPNLNKYINSLLLEGEYVDEENNKYTFTEDLAEFPTMKCKYKIITDTVMSSYDGFSCSDSNQSFFFDFEWKKNLLLIYKAIDPGEDEGKYNRKDKPLFILRQTK